MVSSLLFEVNYKHVNGSFYLYYTNCYTPKTTQNEKKLHICFLKYRETLKKKCLQYLNLILISGQDVNPKVFFFFSFKKLFLKVLFGLAQKRINVKTEINWKKVWSLKDDTTLSPLKYLKELLNTILLWCIYE